MPASARWRGPARSARSPAWRMSFDVHAAQGSAIAAEALERIAALYAVEKEARLAQILDRIPDYKINRIDELLPWNCSTAADPGPIT